MTKKCILQNNSIKKVKGFEFLFLVTQAKACGYKKRKINYVRENS